MSSEKMFSYVIYRGGRLSKGHFWLHPKYYWTSIIYRLAVSYNQPNFTSNASWNPNATTFADNNTIGQSPFDIFINTNNTIYIPNQQTGQIIISSQENQTLITNNSITTSSSNLSNPYSLFVTILDNIYVDASNSMGGGG
jgi:hypothetical protein